MWKELGPWTWSWIQMTSCHCSLTSRSPTALSVTWGDDITHPTALVQGLDSKVLGTTAYGRPRGSLDGFLEEAALGGRREAAQLAAPEAGGPPSTKACQPGRLGNRYSSTSQKPSLGPHAVWPCPGLSAPAARLWEGPGPLHSPWNHGARCWWHAVNIRISE